MTSSQTWSDHSWSGVTGRITSLAWNFVADSERKWGWNVLIGLLLLLPWITICLLITILFMIWWMTRSRHAFVGALCGMVFASLGGLIFLQSHVVSSLGFVTDKIPVINRLPSKTGHVYIDRWSETAVTNMQNYGIPASIILAQGMLESAYGTSGVAVEAHNHFGIKCPGGWTGDKAYYTDDKADECFRKYRSDEESFEDHAKFLRKQPRYASLFSLSRTDYKGWARGLKAAGYATDASYAEKLIDKIEKYDLNRFDHE